MSAVWLLLFNSLLLGFPSVLLEAQHCCWCCVWMCDFFFVLSFSDCCCCCESSVSAATEGRSVLSHAFDRPRCLSGPYSDRDKWPCHVPLVCVGVCVRVSVLGEKRATCSWNRWACECVGQRSDRRSVEVRNMWSGSNTSHLLISQLACLFFFCFFCFLTSDQRKIAQQSGSSVWVHNMEVTHNKH